MTAPAKAENPGETTRRDFDIILFLLVITVTVTGLTMIFSASFVSASKLVGDGTYFFKKQLVYFVFSILLMAFLATVDYRTYQKNCPYIYFGALLFLTLVFVPGVGKKINGASRWISLFGQSFQPSELAKLAAIVFAADFLSRKAKSKRPMTQVILPLLSMIGLLCGVIYLQKDLSTSAEVFLMAFVMCFLSGVSFSSLAYTGGAGMFALMAFILTEEYRIRRLMAFLNPWRDMRDSGYHIIQSLVAVAGGGITGKGLGQAVSKYLYLPEEFTDFIFAVIGEELGFIGGSFIILLFLGIFVRGMRIAMRSPDRFGMILASGLTGIITIQAVINIGVVLSIFPTTGIPLPFVSYGGSSLIVSYMMVGILLNISKHQRTEDESEEPTQATTLMPVFNYSRFFKRMAR